MFNYKSKIENIINKLVAASKKVTASGIEKLLESLGLSGVPAEVSDEMVQGVVEKIKGADIGKIVKVVEECKAASNQLEVKGNIVEPILKSLNDGTTKALEYFKAIEEYAVNIGNNFIKKNLDVLIDSLVRLSVYRKIGEIYKVKLLQSFKFGDVGTQKNMFNLLLQMNVKGPEVMTVEDIAKAKQVVTMLVEKFYKTDPVKLKKGIEDVLKVFDEIEKEASIALEKVEKVHMVLKESSKTVKDRKDVLIKAYGEALKELGSLAEKYPTVKQVKDKVERSAEDLRNLNIEAAGDPSVAPDVIIDLLKSIDTYGDSLAKAVDYVQRLESGEESFEQGVIKKPETEPEQVMESEPESESGLEKGSIAVNKIRVCAAGDFSSVLALIDSTNSEGIWSSFASAIDAYGKELSIAADKGEELYKAFSDSVESLNKIMGESAPDTASSIMEEMSEKMEAGEEKAEPELVAASDNLKMEKKSVKFEVDPKKVREIYEGELKAPKKDLVEKHTKEMDFWKEIMGPDLPNITFLKALSMVAKDIVANLAAKLVGKGDDESKAVVDKIDGAARQEIVERAKEIAQNPLYNEKILFVAKDALTDESKKDAPRNDIISVFATRFSKLRGGVKDELVKYVNDPFSKLLVALVLPGSTAEYDVRVQKMKGAKVDVSELPALLDKATELKTYLEAKVKSAEDEKERTIYSSIRSLLDKLAPKIDALQRGTSHADIDAKAEDLANEAEVFRKSMEENGIDDFKLDAFIGMIQEILEGSGATTQAQSSLDPNLLFVSAAEVDAPLADKSVEESVHDFFDSIWPSIMEIYRNYANEVDTLMEDLVDALVTEESTAPSADVYAPSEFAPAFAKEIDKLVKKGSTDVIAPIRPNEMYSQYDISENTLQVIEENGKKKLCINKNLKNLVTKRINEFLKGAYSEGETVNVDFDNYISMGTVQAYLGNGRYKISVDGRSLEVPEVNLFKM